MLTNTDQQLFSAHLLCNVGGLKCSLAPLLIASRSSTAIYNNHSSPYNILYYRQVTIEHVLPLRTSCISVFLENMVFWRSRWEQRSHVLIWTNKSHQQPPSHIMTPYPPATMTSSPCSTSFTNMDTVTGGSTIHLMSRNVHLPLRGLIVYVSKQLECTLYTCTHHTHHTRITFTHRNATPTTFEPKKTHISGTTFQAHFTFSRGR